MANIYYDFPEIVPLINPFIGGGIGYAFLRATYSSSGPGVPFYYRPSNSAFAYQGTVGMTYNFAENYALNGAYRYSTSNRADDFSKPLRAHMLNLGITYRFDEASYK